MSQKQVQNYEIEGMSCAACVNRVNEPYKIDGVEEAAVNLSTRRSGSLSGNYHLTRVDEIKVVMKLPD